MCRELVLVAVSIALLAEGCAPLDCKSPASVKSYADYARLTGQLATTFVERKLNEETKKTLRQVFTEVGDGLRADSTRVLAVRDLVQGAVERLRIHVPDKATEDLLVTTVVTLLERLRPAPEPGKDLDCPCAVQIVAAAIEGALAGLPGEASQPAAPSVAARSSSGR